MACTNTNINNSYKQSKEEFQVYQEILNNYKIDKEWWKEYNNPELNNYIKVYSKNKKGKEKQCLIHSNRFVLHILLNKNASLLDDESIDFDSYLESEVQQDIETIEKKIVSAIEKKYKTSLVHQVFRNYTKCRDLQALLLK